MQRTFAAALFTVFLLSSPPALAKKPTDADLGQLGKNALVVKRNLVFAKLQTSQVAELKALITLAKKRDPKLTGGWSRFVQQAQKQKTPPEVVAAALALVVNEAMLTRSLRAALGRCKPEKLRLLRERKLARLPHCASGQLSDEEKRRRLHQLQNDLRKMYSLMSNMMRWMHQMQMLPRRSFPPR